MLQLDAPGRMPFHAPAAAVVLFRALEEKMVRQTDMRQLVRLPHHVNDPAFTDALTAAFQSVAAWIRVREPGELTRVARRWRVASLVGVAGMLGSVGWFTAMTLENAAHVKAVGQIELVFTFIASRLFFRERSTALELAGIGLIVAGIVLLLLG